MLAHEQIPPAVSRRTIAGSKLHEHMAVLPTHHKLGMLATGRRPWLPGKRTGGETGIVGSGAGLWPLRQESLERFLPENEIPDAVFSSPCKRDDVVVVAPIGDTGREIQLWEATRKTPADIALESHVFEEGRQPGKSLAVSRLTFKPGLATTEKVDSAMPARATPPCA